jgi:hypothetical protein
VVELGLRISMSRLAKVSQALEGDETEFRIKRGNMMSQRRENGNSDEKEV